MVAPLRARLRRSRIHPLIQRVLRPWHRLRWFLIDVRKYRLVRTWYLGIRRHGWRHRRTILFTPDGLRIYSQMLRIMLLNRYRQFRPEDGTPDLVIYWAYGAGNKPPDSRWPIDLNVRCRDISKERVDVLHHRVFGYGLAVDPLTYHGEAWVKSDDNAQHDGHIETLPVLAAAPGKVYQRLIDNALPDGTRQDIRIPIIRGAIPFAILVHRLLGDRIGERIQGRSQLVDIHEVVSQDEIGRILALSNEIGLDFGELDALRDRTDGRLYVVDVNRAVGAPAVPGELTTDSDYWDQIEKLADMFGDRIHSVRTARSH